MDATRIALGIEKQLRRKGESARAEHEKTCLKSELHHFGGKLDKSRLSFGERAVVFAFRAAEGDFRDWVEIEAWAIEIAEALAAARSGL
jgi:hypothetical protein